MQEIEAATANAEAQGRLSEMKVQLGLAAGPTPQELKQAATPAPATDEAKSE